MDHPFWELLLLFIICIRTLSPLEESVVNLKIMCSCFFGKSYNVKIPTCYLALRGGYIWKPGATTPLFQWISCIWFGVVLPGQTCAKLSRYETCKCWLTYLKTLLSAFLKTLSSRRHKLCALVPASPPFCVEIYIETW